MSPWLFCLFMDDLLEELAASGVWEWDELLALLWVDDIGLLAETVEEAEILLEYPPHSLP